MSCCVTLGKSLPLWASVSASSKGGAHSWWPFQLCVLNLFWFLGFYPRPSNYEEAQNTPPFQRPRPPTPTPCPLRRGAHRRETCSRAPPTGCLQKCRHWLPWTPVGPQRGGRVGKVGARESLCPVGSGRQGSQERLRSIPGCSRNGFPRMGLLPGDKNRKLKKPSPPNANSYLERYLHYLQFKNWRDSGRDWILEGWMPCREMPCGQEPPS